MSLPLILFVENNLKVLPSVYIKVIKSVNPTLCIGVFLPSHHATLIYGALFLANRYKAVCRGQSTQNDLTA